MADTIVAFYGVEGATYDVALYPIDPDSDTAASTVLAVTAETNRKTYFLVTVSEALDGVYLFVATNTGDGLVDATGYVPMRDTTDTYWVALDKYTAQKARADSMTLHRQQINESRIWRPTPDGGPIAPEIVEINDTFVGTVAFDFGEKLNAFTVLSSVVEIVEDGTSNTPTIADENISEDKQLATLTLSGLSASTETRLRADVLTSNGDRLSALGYVYAV